jgi:integrase
VFQRADGRWAGVIDFGHRGGRRRRKTVYGRTRREAAEKLNGAVRAHDDGVLPADADRRTVGQYLEWWVTTVVPPSVRPTTARSYATNVRRHLIPEIGEIQLAKLGPADVQAMINAKLASGLRPRTVQYIHAVLRRALGHAERWGLVGRNVAKLVDGPRVVRPEVVPFTPDEARLFLKAARESRLYALYAVAITVGLRQGEALGLHWQDVDLDAGTLRVRTTVQRIGREVLFLPPKSARSKRVVGLPPVCVEALRAHRRQQLEQHMAAGPEWQDLGLVFTSRVGTPVDARRQARDFETVCTRAGLGHRRMHDLRHTCASLLLAQNVHPRIVMEVLGHSQISLTMNTYSHVLPSLLRDAANLMETMLRPAPSGLGLADPQA